MTIDQRSASRLLSQLALAAMMLCTVADGAARARKKRPRPTPLIARPVDAKPAGVTIQWGEQQNGLKLGVATTKATSAANEKLGLVLAFKNITGKRVWLNAYHLALWRLDWEFTGGPAQRKLRFYPHNPAHRLVDYPSLDQGQTIYYLVESTKPRPGLIHAKADHLDLTETLFGSGGAYTIRLTYVQPNYSTIVDGYKLWLWRGRVASGTARFTVE